MKFCFFEWEIVQVLSHVDTFFRDTTNTSALRICNISLHFSILSDALAHTRSFDHATLLVKLFRGLWISIQLFLFRRVYF